MKFPSIEYCEQYMNKINESEEYEKAAKDWEGDMMYIIEGEGDQLEEGDFFILYLDLWHGKCRDLRLMLKEEEKPDVAFKIRGKESVWRNIMEEGQDAIKLIMANELSVEGDMSKIMRATKAAFVLTKLAREFELDYLTPEEADELRKKIAEEGS